MIIVNLIGGLGNQMFQYACGRALSLRTKQQLRLATDQFHNYSLHNGFDLERVFNIDVPHASVTELKSLLRWQASPRLRKILGRPLMRWATSRNWCNEPYFSYWPGMLDVSHPVYVHGYWQSENYFADATNLIRRDFTFRNALDELDLAIHKRMRAEPSASLHVRRGDYLQGKNQRIFDVCDISYYVEAVQLLRQRLPTIRLFAFSDDPEWVQKCLMPKLGNMEIIRHNKGNRSCNDMRLMSTADHHIIANSSFSWWGAWLNQNKEKIVIAPKKWFSDGRSTSTLLPDTWIRL